MKAAYEAVRALEALAGVRAVFVEQLAELDGLALEQAIADATPDDWQAASEWHDDENRKLAMLAMTRSRLRHLEGARLPFSLRDKRGTIRLFRWALDTVSDEIDYLSTDLKPEHAIGEAYRAAGEVAARTVDEVRRFLNTRGLLVENQTWGEPRLQYRRFIDDKGELLDDGSMLAVDAVLADLYDALKAPKNAQAVRETPVAQRGERWVGPDPKACLVVLKVVWGLIKAERERAKKEAEQRAERQRKVPVPSMHGLTARVVTGLGRQLDTSALRGLAAGIVAPPEPGRWVQLSETAGDTAGVLAAWLATQAHRQWVAGGFEMADRVEVVASKEELVRMGLSSHGGSPVAVLEEALALLESTRLMGGADDKQPGSGRLVLDYFQAAKPRVSPKGGRPSAVYIVTVGWPLMPLRLEALAAERGFTVPRELAWYGPVLNPAWAPLTGNNRTHRTQRLAFAVGAGQWLVSRREEYAELGGVRLDTLRPFLQSMGLYHRSHASLAEDVAERWRLPAGQPPLPSLGPAGPLLVATQMEGVYRLGPDYRAQEALVLHNAEITANAKARVARTKVARTKGGR